MAESSVSETSKIQKNIVKIHNFPQQFVLSKGSLVHLFRLEVFIGHDRKNAEDSNFLGQGCSLGELLFCRGCVCERKEKIKTNRKVSCCANELNCARETVCTPKALN